MADQKHKVGRPRIDYPVRHRQRVNAGTYEAVVYKRKTPPKGQPRPSGYVVNIRRVKNHY